MYNLWVVSVTDEGVSKSVFDLLTKGLVVVVYVLVGHIVAIFVPVATDHCTFIRHFYQVIWWFSDRNLKLFKTELDIVSLRTILGQVLIDFGEASDKAVIVNESALRNEPDYFLISLHALFDS